MDKSIEKIRKSIRSVSMKLSNDSRSSSKETINRSREKIKGVAFKRGSVTSSGSDTDLPSTRFSRRLSQTQSILQVTKEQLSTAQEEEEDANSKSDDWSRSGRRSTAATKHQIQNQKQDKDKDNVGDDNDDPFSVTETRLLLSLQTESDMLDEDEDLDRLEEEMEMNKIPDDNRGFEILHGVYISIMEYLDKQMELGVTLEPIRDEFSALWDGIEESHNNELHLLEKDRAISSDLAVTMAKTRVLIKLADDDPAFAIKLGNKLESVWNLVDIGEAHEQANETKISTLRQDIYDLNRNINAAARIDGQETLNELEHLKEQLEKQRDAANAEANKYRASLHILYARRQELFDHRVNIEEKGKLLDEEYNAQLNAIERETARKERLGIETQEVREKLLAKIKEMEELHRNLAFASTKIVEVEKAVKDQKQINDTSTRDGEFTSNRLEKLRSEVEAERKLVNGMTLEAYKQAQDLKTKEVETQILKEDLMRTSRQRTINVRKAISLKQALGSLEIEREVLKERISLLEKELDTAQKQLEENKRTVENLDKDRSLVNRNLRRAAAVSSENNTQVQTHQLACQNIERTVAVYEAEMRLQTEVISRLEKERDYYSYEATVLAQHVAHKLNDIKTLDTYIMAFKKKLGGLDVQLKKVQQIYDAAVYDKGIFEKTLQDTITEHYNNTVQLRFIANQIAALKTTVYQSDEIIHQEALRYDRILKETEFFSKETRQLRRMVDDIRCVNLALEHERSLIGSSLGELEGELKKQTYYANTAQSRDDVYQRKLSQVQRDLKKVWEKWRQFHSILRMGAYHYRCMIKDIRQLRIQILQYKKLLEIQLEGTGHYARLRREQRIMESQVSKETCMINALVEQMKHPVNVHRWRVLQATDPQAYEMIVRINLLTKKLVDRNCILMKQSKQLTEKQFMYVEIRKCLERSPNLEVPEIVVYYRQLLKTKKNQLRKLKHELIASESQIGYYRGEVKKLNDKMMLLREKYFHKLNTEGLNSSKPTLPPLCQVQRASKSKKAKCDIIHGSKCRNKLLSSGKLKLKRSIAFTTDLNNYYNYNLGYE